MKKYVLGILFCSCLLGTGIGCSEKAREEKIPEAGKNSQNEITIMHVDANYPEFQKFIDQAEKDLDLKIHIVSYPESYMEHIAMLDGKVYSVPYYMDIMVFRVNKSMIGDMEIRTQKDFQRLLETDFGEGRYGYGSAWDSAYVYNELSEFINFFGGSYYDWNSPSTREALTFLADMVKKEQTPIEQITDQYEQLEQKFLEGTYASIFVYSGTLDMFVRAGAYREDFIQLAPLPRFKENTSMGALFQRYVLEEISLEEFCKGAQNITDGF